MKSVGNTANLKPFSSTHQPEKNGRKPSHLKKWIKDEGIATQDIRLLLSGILTGATDIAFLRALLKDPKTPPIILFPVRCLIADYGKGKLDTYKFLIEYGYGMPKQEIEHAGTLGVYAMTPEERAVEIEALLKKRNADRG